MENMKISTRKHFLQQGHGRMMAVALPPVEAFTLACIVGIPGQSLNDRFSEVSRCVFVHHNQDEFPYRSSSAIYATATLELTDYIPAVRETYASHLANL